MQQWDETQAKRGDGKGSYWSMSRCWGGGKLMSWPHGCGHKDDARHGGQKTVRREGRPRSQESV